MNGGFVYIQLLLAVTIIGLTQGSHYSRDESSENDKTEFNLASTYTGGITSNRHHARAHLSSQLYPDVRQPPFQPPATGYSSSDIDDPSAHESGGSSNHVLVSPGNRQLGTASIYPALPEATPVPVPAPVPVAVPAPGYPAPPTSGYPIATNLPNSNFYYGYQPQYQPPNQLQYLPHVPQYPQPRYPVYFSTLGQPAVVPPQSYQNYHQQQPYYPAPGQREHFDRSFTMNTEYKEDGVHTGPFEVLNNHNKPGYGSGYGGGYNGAFNRPGY